MLKNRRNKSMNPIEKNVYDAYENIAELYDKEFHKPIHINHKASKFHLRNGSISLTFFISSILSPYSKAKSFFMLHL